MGSKSTLTSPQGSISFSVVSEERPDHVTDVTEYPIEYGRDISDHAALRPITLTIEGVVTGSAATTTFSSIEQWQKDRLLVTYSGRRTYRDYVIKEFRPTEDAVVGDGFRFILTFQEVKIASPASVQRVKRDPALPKIIRDEQVATQVNPVAEKGRDQPQPAPAWIPEGVINSVNVLRGIFSKNPG